MDAGTIRRGSQLSRRPFLDARRLRYFLAIAQHGSLSAAARSLRIAQPALSHHVAELEGWLGKPLLRRHASGVELTRLGERLVHHARLITEAIQDAEQDLIQSSEARIHSPLRIAIIPSLASVITPRLVRKLREVVPGVPFSIIDARTELADDLVLNGRADVAVRLGDPSDAREEPLVWEPLYWIQGYDAHRPPGPVSFTEVAESRLVLPSQASPLRRHLESVARDARVELKIAMEVDGPDLRRQAVLAGVGATVVGAHSVAGKGLGPGLSAQRIADPRLTRPITLTARDGMDPFLEDVVRNVLLEILSDIRADYPD